MNRANIPPAVKTLLQELNIFKNIYTAQTDLYRENSFPIAWVLLGNEATEAGTINTPNRLPKLIIRIAVKQNRGEDEINGIIDNVYEKILDNPTLNDTVIKSDLETITTSEGLLYPYEVAELTYNVLIR